MNRRESATRKKLFWATLQIAVALGIYTYVSFAAPQVPGQVLATEPGDSATSSGRSPGSSGKGKRTGHGTSVTRVGVELAKPSSRDHASAPVGDGNLSTITGSLSDPNGTSLLTEVQGLLPENRAASHGWLSSRVQDLAKGWSAVSVRERVARLAADVGNAVWDLTKRAASLLRTRAIELWAAVRKDPGLPETGARAEGSQPDGVAQVLGAQAAASQTPAAQAPTPPVIERTLATGRSTANAGSADPGPTLPLAGQRERFF